MRQSLSRSLALLVLGVFLVAPAHAGDDKDKNPEDVFKAFAAAIKKEEVKAIISHLSRNSQSAIAGFMLFLACDEGSDKKGEEVRKLFEDLLKRHGISSDDALRKIPEDRWDLFAETLGGKFPKTMVALGEMVKDKPAFVEDVLKIATKHLGLGIEQFKVKEIGEAKIKDLKIEGEQAKGQVTIPGADGKENKGTIYFKLESGVWKIDLIETYRNWPQPPPPPQVQPHEQPQVAPSYSRPGMLRRLLDRLFNR
jgi:hypothetical protein